MRRTDRFQWVCPAAVDGEDLSGDVRGVVGGEEQDGGRELLGSTGTSEGGVLGDPVPHALVLQEPGGAAGEEARGDGVDPDAGAAPLGGQLPGQAVDAGLAGRIRRQPEPVETAVSAEKSRRR